MKRSDLAEKLTQICKDKPYVHRPADDLWSADSERFAGALVELVTSNDTEDNSAALRLALDYKVTLPIEPLRKLISVEPDGLRERVWIYINHFKIQQLLPEMRSAFKAGDPNLNVFNRIIGGLISFRDAESWEALREHFDQVNGEGIYPEEFLAIDIENRPDAALAINPLPEKTQGAYVLAKIGTPIPSLDIHSPDCPNCDAKMACLLQLPKAADPEQTPIFHCRRCVFHQPIFLQDSENSFRWLGEIDAEVDEDEDFGSGYIVWGSSCQAPGTSSTFIGGEPQWVQSDDGPLDCPACDQQMEFLLQLNSTNLGDLFLEFYYFGVMYLYRCRSCQVSGYYFQTS